MSKPNYNNRKILFYDKVGTIASEKNIQNSIKIHQSKPKSYSDETPEFYVCIKDFNNAWIIKQDSDGYWGSDRSPAIKLGTIIHIERYIEINTEYGSLTDKHVYLADTGVSNIIGIPSNDLDDNFVLYYPIEGRIKTFKDFYSDED
jgi:hypothetical protein